MTTAAISDYLEFLHQGCTPFHVVAAITQRLKNIGFQELALSDPHWDLAPDQGYCVSHREGKTCVAWLQANHTALKQPIPCAMIGAHTDSPVLRLRLSPWEEKSPYQRLTTQTHGSLIYRSWLDRPLALAGAIYERGPAGTPIRRLVHSHKALAVIPDLAIHLDREKNTQGSINPEKALSAFLSSTLTQAQTQEALASVGIVLQRPQTLGWELSLVPAQEPTCLGMDDSFIVGPRQDDLAMVYCALKALEESRHQASEHIRLVVFFDSEETGSTTAGGAQSSFLRDVLERLSPMPLSAGLQRSFLLSADMAHAWHPSYPDRHDDEHKPLLNQGLVLKENASDRYATSGFSGAWVQSLAEQAQVPLQYFIARQDIGCGSTIGPLVAAELAVSTADVGLPMWAMHSAAECTGSLDLNYGIAFMRQALTCLP